MYIWTIQEEFIERDISNCFKEAYTSYEKAIDSILSKSNLDPVISIYSVGLYKVQLENEEEEVQQVFWVERVKLV